MRMRLAGKCRHPHKGFLIKNGFLVRGFLIRPQFGQKRTKSGHGFLEVREPIESGFLIPFALCLFAQPCDDSFAAFYLVT